jgi:hypothetical protein
LAFSPAISLLDLASLLHGAPASSARGANVEYLDITPSVFPGLLRAKIEPFASSRSFGDDLENKVLPFWTLSKNAEPKED